MEELEAEMSRWRVQWHVDEMAETWTDEDSEATLRLLTRGFSSRFFLSL